MVISSGEGDALEVEKSPYTYFALTTPRAVILSGGGSTAVAEGSQYLYPQTLIFFKLLLVEPEHLVTAVLFYKN